MTRSRFHHLAVKPLTNCGHVGDTQTGRRLVGLVHREDRGWPSDRCRGPAFARARYKRWPSGRGENMGLGDAVEFADQIAIENSSNGDAGRPSNGGSDVFLRLKAGHDWDAAAAQGRFIRLLAPAGQDLRGS